MNEKQKEEKTTPEYMSIDEIFELLANAMVDLKLAKIDIDIVGGTLTQDIAPKLEEFGVEKLHEDMTIKDLIDILIDGVLYVKAAKQKCTVILANLAKNISEKKMRDRIKNKKFEMEILVKDYINKGYDHTTTIVHDFYKETEEYGNLSWNIADYQYKLECSALINPDELLIPDKQIYIIYNYPLSVTVRMKFTHKGGFRRKDIVRCVYEGYKYIYEEETAQVGDPGTCAHLYNRRKSNDPFGIWGHYLEDLVLSRIIYFPQEKTVRLITES